MARVFIEGGGTLEHRVIGQQHVLGDELTVELADILHDLGVLVRELPVTCHDIDAQQIAGTHHVAAAGPVRCSRPLPGVAAIEQKRIPGPGFLPEAIHKSP